jgi:hypothetical protein
LFALESPALDDIVTILYTNLTEFLAVQQPPLVRLPPIPEDQKPLTFLNATFNLKDIVNATLRNLSSTYFLQVMQTSCSDMFVITLNNYLNGTLRNALQNNLRLRNRQVNITALIDEIADEIFSDETIKRYSSWFCLPTSRSRYIRVYKYLENRFYKLLSDAISRSGSLSQHAHYAVLKEIMSAITDSSLRSILWAAYSRNAGSLITRLALSNYTEATYAPSNRLTKGDLFLALVRETYNTPWSLDPNRALNPDVNVERDVRTNLANVLNRVDQARSGQFKLNKTQTLFNTRSAIDSFRRINLRRARYAEFSGDNKKVCATVYRHNLVREAIFNEEKFRFCRRVVDSYQNSSLSATLGPISEIRRQIDRLLEIKAAFYCAACSVKDSRSIDVTSNNLQMSSDFCFNFVSKFKTYLDWRYTVFQNFQYQLFQYLSCFGRNANLTDTFPYTSFDNLLPENFTSWEECKNVTNVKDIAACLPVCSKISLTTFSAVIEGDREHLKRLYNYAVNVLRQYGVEFGTYEVNRNYTNKPFNVTAASAPAPDTPAAGNQAATIKSGSRVLQETKRPVLYHLKAEPRQSQRILQTNPPATGGSSASGTPAPASGGSQSATAGSITASSGSTDPLKDKKTLLLKSLLKDLEKLSTFTQEKHYEHDEMTAGRMNYQVAPPISDLKNMTVSLSSRGIDPFKHLPNIKFGEFMLRSFTESQNRIKTEPLDRQVIKDCVQVSSKDVDMFNGDTELDISPAFKPLVVGPIIKLMQSADFLFARYNTKSRGKWIASGAAVQTSQATGAARRLKTNKAKQTKKTSRGSFVSNLFFKVLF